MIPAICLIYNFNYFQHIFWSFVSHIFFLARHLKLRKNFSPRTWVFRHLLGNHHFTAIFKSSWKFYTLFKSISNVAAKVLFQCLLGSKYCTNYLILYIEICYKPNGYWLFHFRRYNSNENSMYLYLSINVCPFYW